MSRCIMMMTMTGGEEEGGDECARFMRKYAGTVGMGLPFSVAIIYSIDERAFEFDASEQPLAYPNPASQLWPATTAWTTAKNCVILIKFGSIRKSKESKGALGFCKQGTNSWLG